MATARDASRPKEWKFPSECHVEQSIIDAAGKSDILAKLLVRRGLRTPGEVEAFLDPAKFVPSDPSEFSDTPRAVARIMQAIAGKEKITVYGDYDVDGVTATAVMLTTLRLLGAEADFYIPTRAEGYGLNLKAVSVLASKHRTKLMITCDCGISNFSEINFARSLGVDTIVLDHHTMPDLLPPASAILHPKQLPEEHPLFHLPGVGVAYKLSEALLLHCQRPEEVEKLLDFVTLGMIADMVPLTKECRYLVQIGMPKLVSSTRAGIKALLAQVTNKGEGTDLVGFGLAPRINAVGRLSDANLAVKLMITEDEAEATELARQLETENLRRQELCEQIFQKADLRAAQAVQSGDKAIAIYDSGWHHGVVGIVASRLVEKYHCPVFIGELDEKEGIVKGSARGISGIDLYEVLKANEHLALKWGGHKMAAGWSAEVGKAELFCRGIVETCNRMLGEQQLRATIEIDLEVQPEEVTLDLTSTLSKLAPFGMSNKKPLLAMRGQECVGTRTLGKDNKHNRVNLMGGDGYQFECVFWNSRDRVPFDGQTVDVVFTPEANVYNGSTRLQLVLNDWRDPSQPLPPAVVAAEALPSVTAAASVPGPAGAAIGSTEGAIGTEMPSALQAQQFAIPELADGRGGAPATANADPQTLSFDPDGDCDAILQESDSLQMASDGSFSAAPGGTLPGGKDHQRSAASATGHMVARSIEPDSFAKLPPVVWKDLRGHAAPQSLLDAALRKLGTGVSVFGESTKFPDGIEGVDRVNISQTQHLIIWGYPAADNVFKQILERSGARTVYLVGGVKPAGDDAPTFLKRLLGLVRYAVNQRDGQAEPDKVAAALGTTKMSIALGLTILKKLNVIDWFAEDGIVNLDIVGQPEGKAEQLPEYRQLVNCLNDIIEFRRWCEETPLKEIQLHFGQGSSQNTSFGQAGISSPRAYQPSTGITT